MTAPQSNKKNSPQRAQRSQSDALRRVILSECEGSSFHRMRCAHRSVFSQDDCVAAMRPKPAAGNGQILFTNEEFAELWEISKNRLVVFADSGAMNRFEYLIGTQPRIVFELGDTVLVENRGAERS